MTPKKFKIVVTINQEIENIDLYTKPIQSDIELYPEAPHSNNMELLRISQIHKEFLLNLISLL